MMTDLANCRAIAMAFASLALLAQPAAAREQVAEKPADRAVGNSMTMPVPTRAETIAVELISGGASMWSGRLRLGPMYGNAGFNQSINEYAGVCPTGSAQPGAEQQSSNQLSFYLNRTNWQQEPDKFTVNFSVTRPLSPCMGEGNDTLGLNRTIILPPGKTVRVTGEGGIEVRLTRLAG